MGDYKLSASLRGHEDDVRCVAFPHPDFVLSASRDRSVRLWKNEHVTPPRFDSTIVTHGTEFVNAVTFIPPSSKYPEGLIVSGGKDAIIDVRAPSKLPEDNADGLLLGHASNVCALDATADGRLIISGSWDGDARVWEVGKWDAVTVLEGHTASVWAVLALDHRTIITGCADKKIRVFQTATTGTSSVFVRAIETGDVVRALCTVDSNNPSNAQFASAGNDAVIRLWQLNGRQVAELHGHENFIYSLASLPGGRLASSSEDRTVRIWHLNQCIQTITHPAISVWSVAACAQNGDIVTGASDRIVRIFSQAPGSIADPTTIEQFNNSVRESSIPQQAVDNFNKEKLPGPEFLTQKSGTKEGQVQMINEANGNVTAYQWSTAANEWLLVGTVVDNASSSGRKISFNGKEYDYLFDVDIEDGKPPLKLPYNLSQNPYEVARKFCEDNKLPITYLDQVTNFIVQNTQGATLGQSGQSGPQGADPWGTESRYRPGDVFPQTEAAPPKPRQSVLPQKQYLSILTANLGVVLKKIKEYNQELVNSGQKDLSLNPDDIDCLNEAIDDMEKETERIDANGINAILKTATGWPPEKRLPGLDLLRLLTALEEPIQYLIATVSFIEDLEEAGIFVSSTVVNNAMMAIRSFVNLFNTEYGRAHADKEFDRIHKNIHQFITSTNRNLIIAITTLYINYAVMLKQSKDVNADRALTLLDDLSKILSTATDSEAVYRALVATGTLLHLGDDFCEAGRDVFSLGTAVAHARDKVKEPRVKNVVAEIQEKLKG
ncbi:PFU-domain-containing protein [Lindgomyces ingoldianus]|uniref:PFU-domain-containing protein n=1 Tax=Lindgomyces ingoldianus TaxID=673940 RepID=A0ACB6QDM0_9PLEO|nr:PFU-domain-containing protein [Lindgomyces ingoldianus]KAF2464240.1 PFU-domain-containing protein [Lindgomyces ingoldianus]